MSEHEKIKYCPKLIQQQEVKALMIGKGDKIITGFSPCLKEQCAAYTNGYCSEYRTEV